MSLRQNGIERGRVTGCQKPYAGRTGFDSTFF